MKTKNYLQDVQKAIYLIQNVDGVQKQKELAVDSAINTVQRFSQRPSTHESQRQENTFEEFLSLDINSQEPAPGNNEPNVGYEEIYEPYYAKIGEAAQKLAKFDNSKTREKKKYLSEKKKELEIYEKKLVSNEMDKMFKKYKHKHKDENVA